MACSRTVGPRARRSRASRMRRGAARDRTATSRPRVGTGLFAHWPAQSADPRVDADRRPTRLRRALTEPTPVPCGPSRAG
jgi:hypothetical protein